MSEMYSAITIVWHLPLVGSVSWNASGWSGLSPITTIPPTMEFILLGLVLNCKHSVSVRVILLGLVLNCRHSVSVEVILLGLVLNCKQCISEGQLTGVGFEL